MSNTISVLLIEPGKYPKMIEIENTLEAKQKLVGGNIEMLMPFEDEVAIICNDEGKIIGLPENRGVHDDCGGLLDFVFGTFLVVYAPVESENFESLPEKLAEKYKQVFLYPETLVRIFGKLCSVACPVDEKH